MDCGTKTMTIVITGANGFTGAALCRYFYALGHDVIATGRQLTPHPTLLRYAKYVPGDITKPVKEFNADVCIHAAGLASDNSDYGSLFLNNVTGTKNVIEAAKNCRTLIFISSSSVYSFCGKPAVETDAVLNAPISDYGKTKLLAEKLLEENIPSHQTRLILRPRAIYGVGDRVLLPRLLNLIRGKIVFCPVPDGVLTSAISINNLAYAIELYLNRADKPPLLCLNIADHQVYKLKDIILKILETIEGPHLKVLDVSSLALKILPVIASKTSLIKQLSPVAINAMKQNSVLDLTNINNTLNYKPAYTFDNSYKEIGDWLRYIGGKKIYLQNLKNAPWILKNPH